MRTRKTFKFGAINLRGTGKRYPVTVEIQLYERGGNEILERCSDGTFTGTGKFTPRYLEFTAMATAGACIGGQCLDEINEHRLDFRPAERMLWDRIYKLWQRYHLNGMHAGTPEQEEAVKAYHNQHKAVRHDYEGVCNYLKEIGLYEVLYTGKTSGRMYNNEPYKYGHGWIVQDIPEEDIQKIRDLLDWED